MATSSSKGVKRKCFNDPVHKHIELHPLLVKFINTPQFQRLKNIKQLGGNYFVYPGASHNRFEHSIGTCHLAGELVKHLKSQQVEQQQQQDEKKVEQKFKITDEDVLCVELAGLCHDLGHGPFSHMFDKGFLEDKIDYRKIGHAKKPKNWEHEERSCLMFDRILEENEGVRKEFEKRLRPEKDGSDVTKCRNAIFVKEMINGPRPDSSDNSKDDKKSKTPVDESALKDQDNKGKSYKYRGREEIKKFLYEIVANKPSGVDVDKWDYFARDCHQLGIANSFDHIRFMRNMKVLDCRENENDVPDYHICVRDKECKNLYEMFHTRDALHRRAYKHKVSTAVEAMICDAMWLVNDYIMFEGKPGEMKTMAESVDDMAAFEKLSDNIIQEIYYSTDPSGATEEEKKAREKARAILKNVFVHDYYILIGTERVPEGVLPVEEQTITFTSKKEEWKIIQKIHSSTDPSDATDQEKDAREKARAVLKNVLEHDLHIQIGTKKIPEGVLDAKKQTTTEKSKLDKLDEWKKEAKKHFRETFKGLEEHYYFRAAQFDFGMKAENPVDEYWFYSKDEESKPKKMKREEISHMLPKHFMDVELEVYCKTKSMEGTMRERFNTWKGLMEKLNEECCYILITFFRST